MNKKNHKNENYKIIAENNNNNNNSDYEDNLSLGSVLSDYQSIFYDAQSINEDFNLKNGTIANNKKNVCNENLAADDDQINIRNEMIKLNLADGSGGSIDSSFDDNNSKTDEDVELMSLDDETHNLAGYNKNNTNRILEHEETIINDDDIDLEFETYLNDDDSNDQDDDDFSDEYKSNKLKILNELDYDNVDNLDLIKQLAIDKYGFMKKKFRRKAWPILIMNDDQQSSTNKSYNKSIEKFNKITQEEIKNNRYYNQVTLDVIRTLKRFPPEISDKLRNKLQHKLIDLICKILVKNDNLHYYQGYHDICLTFLLVTGVDNSLPLLENVTLTHLTPYMETTMETTLKLLFNIMPLIDKINFQVAEHIQKAELGVIFCISWLITWYSHVMDNLKIILRLYDFFIATHPLMPIYLGAIIVSDKSSEILDIDCDMASLHTVITKYPSKIEDIELMENYITSALKLFDEYPPNTLANLNEKWLEKCKTIELKMQEERRLREQEETKLRQRRNKKSNKNNEFDDDESSNNKIAKRNYKTSLIKFGRGGHQTNGKKIANKFIFGLTFTVGVAAVAMYAINSNASQPHEIFSKFYHLLS